MKSVLAVIVAFALSVVTPPVCPHALAGEPETQGHADHHGAHAHHEPARSHHKMPDDHGGSHHGCPADCSGGPSCSGCALMVSMLMPRADMPDRPETVLLRTLLPKTLTLGIILSFDPPPPRV